MLIIAGTITIDPADIEAAREAAATMMAASNAEAGCIEYSFNERIGAPPGTLTLYERWTDDEALAAHFAAPHMAEFRAALGELTILGRDVRIWRGLDDGEPLG